MNQDISLKENIHYGTKEHPISRLHFDTGAGTPYPEYFFVARHWHHYMEILYIEKGSFEFEINLQSFTLSQGDICILNPGDLHQIKGNSSDTKHNVILFDPCILDFSYEDEMQEKCIRPLINQLALLPNIYCLQRQLPEKLVFRQGSYEYCRRYGFRLVYDKQTTDSRYYIIHLYSQSHAISPKCTRTDKPKENTEL